MRLLTSPYTGISDLAHAGRTVRPIVIESDAEDVLIGATRERQAGDSDTQLAEDLRFVHDAIGQLLSDPSIVKTLLDDEFPDAIDELHDIYGPGQLHDVADGMRYHVRIIFEQALKGDFAESFLTVGKTERRKTLARVIGAEAHDVKALLVHTMDLIRTRIAASAGKTIDLVLVEMAHEASQKKIPA